MKPRIRHHPGPSAGALAEALFALSEQEPAGDRRVALLKAGYAVFDAPRAPGPSALSSAPEWLKPLVSQLLDCRGPDALAAAVQRLGSGGQPRRRATRDGYLARVEVAEITATGPDHLRPERLRGAIHWHTSASDGKASLERMANACRRRGVTWAMVSDHSRGLEVASGLDREGVRLQARAVERWNRRHGDDLRLVHGLEVEVLEDGTLDVPAGERLEVECVLAAVHRHFDPDRDQTERLLRAVSTPGVDVLAHPRGRQFHHRPGLRARWEKVFTACHDHGVAVEINGFPRRQDLDAELARIAVDAGCDVVLASDAHAPHHLEFDAYACAIATCAGVPREHVLNLLHPEEVAVWLSAR